MMSHLPPTMCHQFAICVRWIGCIREFATIGVFILEISLATQPTLANETPAAFPGAEGFGAQTIGGRGGKVIFVTNLQDHGVGSLRAAIEQKGPRVVLFRTGGTIELESPLDIRESHVTIVGQSAPGGGICLKNYGVRIRDTKEVVLRYLRVRPGAEHDSEGDALLIHRSQNVIVDHCSLSWSVDETLDISDDWHEPIDGPKSDNITIGWCILSESLNRSVHAKGEHGYAALISAIRDGDVTVHHNLFAHHLTRIPRPGGRRGTPGLRLEFRDNVIYDWGANFAGYSADSETASALQLSYTGNFLKPGPSTPPKGRYVAFFAAATTQMFVADNELAGFEAANEDNWLMIKNAEQAGRLMQPVVGSPYRASSPDTVLREVLSGAGATKPERDSVDQRIVRQVQLGTGALIDSPEEVGGWPDLSAGAPLADDDNDGLPSAWEVQNGLDPHDATDASSDADRNGYTSLEDYLNGLTAVPADGCAR